MLFKSSTITARFAFSLAVIDDVFIDVIGQSFNKLFFMLY